MDIKAINGDILDIKEGVIVHQVNTLGVMGAGLALQIKNKFPESYADYKSITDYYDQSNSEHLLGKTLISDAGRGVYIAHLFAQSSIGRGELHTNYGAFESGLMELKNHLSRFKMHHLPIYFPYKIGCGLGGGDWGGVIKPLIKKHFPESIIVKYDKKG